MSCEPTVKIAHLRLLARSLKRASPWRLLWLLETMTIALNTFCQRGRMGKKLFSTVLGLVLVLGWWTLRDKLFGGSSTAADSDRIPAKVLGGWQYPDH